MATPSPELLQRVDMFSTLERKELERLANTFKERTFQPGDTIASEGKSGVGFFVIEEGSATVSVGGNEVGKLGAGDHFGEITLIDEGARTATVTADTELHCYGLTFWEFRPIVETNAEIAWKLLQGLAKKLREVESRAGSGS